MEMWVMGPEIRRNGKHLKLVKPGSWRRRNVRRRKNLPSNTILLCVLFVLIYGAYQFQDADLSFANLKEKVAQTSTTVTSKPKGKILEGRITHVRDGDTFEVNGIPVRISALDCPESSTSAGQKLHALRNNSKVRQPYVNSLEPKLTTELLGIAQSAVGTSGRP